MHYVTANSRFAVALNAAIVVHSHYQDKRPIPRWCVVLLYGRHFLYIGNKDAYFLILVRLISILVDIHRQLFTPDTKAQLGEKSLVAYGLNPRQQIGLEKLRQ